MSEQNVKDEWRDFREDYRNNRVPTGVMLIFKSQGKKVIGFFTNGCVYHSNPDSTGSVPTMDNMTIDEYKIIDMKKIGD